MRTLCTTVLIVLSLGVANAAHPIDHLEPVEGTLFDYQFMHESMLRARKELLGPGRKDQMEMIQIVGLNGYPLPRVDLVQLLLVGDPYSPETAKYVLVYRQVLNPEIYFTEEASGEAKLQERKTQIDQDLAMRMMSFWTPFVMQTKYFTYQQKEQAQIQDPGSNYHSVFILGEGTYSGVAPNVGEGPLFELYEAVRYLGKWINSEGKDETQKIEFLKKLKDLEVYYSAKYAPTPPAETKR